MFITNILLLFAYNAVKIALYLYTLTNILLFLASQLMSKMVKIIIIIKRTAFFPLFYPHIDDFLPSVSAVKIKHNVVQMP